MMRGSITCARVIPAEPGFSSVWGGSNWQIPAAALPSTAGVWTSVDGGGPTGPSLDVTIDFTRPDGNRTRPLLVEGKRLYVDEHYISVWSPVLRAWCIECPDRELILANVQYDHVLEMLECIHPTYKAIDDQSVHVLLPLGFDYQMEGLLHRCECFLITHNLPFLEKVWLADRYKLNRLLALCLREMRPNAKIDMSGAKYYALSDRVKVLLLERLHGSPPPDEIAEPPLDLDAFQRSTDLNFAAIRAKTGRVYFVNPYYVAAWSNVFHDRILTNAHVEELYSPCSHEELSAFLMAIHPPQLRINEQNIGPVLMAACKMESPGLLKKCAAILLSPQTHLSVFVRLSLLDRCFLHDMLPACLQMVQRPEHLIQMTQQATYECLSTRARASMLDRLATLLDHPGLQPHTCQRCKQPSACSSVTWMCPMCKSYSSDANLLKGSNPATGTASNYPPSSSSGVNSTYPQGTNYGGQSTGNYTGGHGSTNYTGQSTNYATTSGQGSNYNTNHATAVTGTAHYSNANTSVR